jgi:hypothetical protein
MIEYAVWVGGSEIGQYASLDQAEEVYRDWRDDGYDDVAIQEISADIEQKKVDNTVN